MSVEFRPSFLGTGSYHPKNKVSNEMVGEFVADYFKSGLEEKGLSSQRVSEILEIRKRGIVEIAKEIGVENRYWLGEGESTSTMGIEAGHRALEASGLSASEIRGVILSTGMGDYVGTATSAIIAKELGVPEKVMTHDISAACTGFAHALYEAYTNLTSPMSLDGPILVVSSEPISQGMHPSKKSTVPIFGDGAGAAVVGLVEVEGDQPWPKFTFGAIAEDIDKLLIQVGGSVKPITPETTDGERGIYMDNRYIFRLAREKMIQAGQDVTREGEEFNKILGKQFRKPVILIPHQANLLIMTEVQVGLGFMEDQVVVNIGEYANTGSASIPIALDEAIREGRLTDKDAFMGVVFGSGIIYAGFIVYLYGLGKKWSKYPHGQLLNTPSVSASIKAD